MDDYARDRLGELFERAVGLPAHARGAFVHSCSDDPEVRSELASLLAAHDESPDLLERIAADLSPAALLAGPTPIAPGTRLGRYEIQECIGAGGIGIVYRAFDTTLHRPVALKTLDRHTPDARESLLREARAASALNHPHICTIYEVAEHDGVPLIAMEYVEGRSLQEEIATGGASFESAVRLGIQIARALAHAHRRGIVHRDLKSANVMIAPEGQAKVLDFGLSGPLSRPDGDVPAAPASSVAANGPPVGTLPYLAPEVLQGSAADMRSDVWAFGVLLYEITSGKRPFRGATRTDLRDAVLEAAAPPLSPQVPAPLRSVISRCLERDPLRRYENAEEVRSALERVQAFGAAAASRSGGASEGAGARPRHAAVRARPAVLLLAIALGTAAIAVLPSGSMRSDGRGVAPAQIRSLAVLPLANASGDVAREYFLDGLTDAITSELAQLGAVTVISQTSSMQYKRTTKPVAEIARELGVDAVVEGAAALSGQHVSMTMELVHAQTDRRLWTKKYEADLRDAGALPAQIARDVAAAIRTSPAVPVPARFTRAVDPEAYDLYLRGLSARGTGAYDAATVAPYFEKAVAKASDFAHAHAALALAWAQALFGGPLSPREILPKIEAAARAAVRLDDSLAEAHSVLALVYDVYGDRARADSEARRAREVGPMRADTFGYEVRALIRAGRFEDSVAAARRARELDPLVLNRTMWVARALRSAGDYDAAVAELRAALARAPGAADVHFQLGATHVLRGDVGAGIAELERAVSLSSARNPRFLAYLAYAYAAAGRTSEARKILQDLLARRRKEYVSAFGIALVHDALGEARAALAALETARREHAIEFNQIDTYPAFRSRATPAGKPVDRGNGRRVERRAARARRVSSAVGQASGATAAGEGRLGRPARAVAPRGGLSVGRR